MTNWKPSHIFTVDKTLRLSPAEKVAIQRKLPRAEDGNYYVDAVFEGGGVKGTAFLGALRCFDDAGIKFRKVAGTSAGAITAAMVAAGFTLNELEDILGQLDYLNDLLNKKTSRFILNGSPDDDLKNPLLMVVNLLLVGQQGQYSSEPFLRWLKHHIDRKIPTFASIQPQSRAWYHQRELRVVISDISQKAMRVLPVDLDQYGESPRTFSVAEAVRLSMSIPFFFQPGKLGRSTIVDGGILSNFPLWIYDAPEHQQPKCPTFGFRLVDPEPESVKPTKDAVGLFKNMLNTMQVAGDRHYVDRNDQGRVIKIGTMGIATTQFNLTNADKDALYKEGYEKAKTFLLKQWSWKAHLAARGFSEMGVQELTRIRPLAA